MLSRSRILFERTLAQRNEQPPWVGYTVTLLVVAVAFGLSLLVPAIRTGTPFVFFYLAITISAFVGRLRAALLAIVLSALLVSFGVMPHEGSLVPTTVQSVQLITFFLVSWIIAWLVHTHNTARSIILEEREWLRITLGSIADAVIATDAQGKITWMNPVAVALTGWRDEDAVGRPLAEIFHIVNEESRLPVDNPVERALAEQRVVGLANHTILIAKDGVERPIEDSAAPIYDAENHIRGAVLVFHDSSERRTRERALTAAEERLRLALDAGRMVAWEWDPQQGQIWTTDNYASIYGGPLVDEATENLEVIHPDDRARHHEVSAAARQGGSYHLEFRIIRPDNHQVVWLEEWGVAVKDLAGQVTRIVGVAMDVTHRKQTEAEVRSLNAELYKRVQELQAIFYLAPVGIAVTYDPLCQEVTANATLNRWLGLSPGTNATYEGNGQTERPFRVLLNDQEPPAAVLPMERAIAEAATITNVELQFVRQDGEQVSVVAAATPIYGEDRCVTGCISTYADITAQKRAETALKQLNETLELRVAERTAELQQINHELDQFAYVASHDLKSPLRGIATLSGWIQDDAGELLPPQSKEHLEKIQQRIRRMETLLNDLLAYSRAGRARYPVELIDVPALVHDMPHLLNLPPGFTVTVAEPLPSLTAERVPLETVLRNLIGNAAKHHHHPDTGHVTISARDLGSVVEFTITDDGPGIAPDFHERIFRVFQTLRPRDEVEGSGMGLAIVKRLVEGRGGVIEVASETGAGATFRFTWPKRDDPST